MVEEKQEGVYFTPPPPGKIGLTDKFGHDGIFSRPLIIFISKIMQRNLEITFDSWEVTSSTKMTTIYTC